MPQRVLIVDDDQDLREMMAMLLRNDGFEADVAADGQEALDKARAHPPNVIVLDMKLPVMDGWTFRAHQRYDEVLAPIPVVLLTALPLARLKNVGAVAALQKPLDYQALISTLRTYC